MGALDNLYATTDFSKYNTWDVVYDPATGREFRVIPGYGGQFVLDVNASAASGTVRVINNPTPQFNAQKEGERKQKLQEDLVREEFENKKKLGDPVNQLIIGAGIPAAGLAAGELIKNSISGTPATTAAGQAIGQASLPTAGTTTAANAAGQGALAAQTAPATPEILSVGGAAPVEAAGPFSLGGIGSAGNAYLPALGAFGAYDVLANDRGPVRGTLQGAASGAAIGSYFGGVGAIPGAIVGGLAGLGRSLFDHESTREHAQKNTSNLLGRNPNDAQYQNYVQSMRRQYDSAPPDPSKPFAGKYSNWNEYKNAGLEAGDLTGVYGNIDTFGSDWTRLSQPKRQEITQKLIDADLYVSDRGEVKIKNKNKAKEIFANALVRNNQPPSNVIGRIKGVLG